MKMTFQRLLPVLLSGFFLTHAGLAQNRSQSEILTPYDLSEISLIVLGTAQDAGSPQIGCVKECCLELQQHHRSDRKVACLGLHIRESGQRFLLEATPDLPMQLAQLQAVFPNDNAAALDGIFITHAHIGHYTGLMYLGKESMDARDVPVYGLPRMIGFLESNGPWDLLAKRGNIRTVTMEAGNPLSIGKGLSITAIPVPHRDEYSETAGFLITGPHKKALFIPDIDKWERWNQDIMKWLKEVDLAFLDATFFDGQELPGRNMAEIPHPSVQESMDRFEGLSASDRAKIHFIHLNHTNPLWNKASAAWELVAKKGFRVARDGMTFRL